MKFGKSNMEIPPKKSVEELSPEELEARREGVRIEEAILAYQDEWSQKMTDSGLPTSNAAVLPFSQARAQARQLAQAYGSTKSAESRATYMRALEDKLEELEGPLTENLQKAIIAHEAYRRERAETPVGETKAKLVQTVEEVEKVGTAEPKSEKLMPVPEDVREEKAAMQAAENAYFEAYKKSYEKAGPMKGKDSKELKQLKQTFAESRLAYANALTESAWKRLDARGMKPGVGEKKERNHIDVLQRYNRLVRYNEIIKPVAEKRYNLRLEAMGARERGIFSKGTNWLRAKNEGWETKWGKDRVRLAKAVATTLVAGTVGVASGAIAAVGVVGLAGWGIMRVARTLGAGALSMAVAESVAQTYGRTLGKYLKGRSEDKLSYVGRTAGGLTLEDLEKHDRAREGHLRGADERTLEQEKAALRMLVAFGVGAGVSSSLQHLPSAHHVVDEMSKAHPGNMSPTNADLRTHPSSPFSDTELGKQVEPSIATASTQPLAAVHHDPQTAAASSEHHVRPPHHHHAETTEKPHVARVAHEAAPAASEQAMPEKAAVVAGGTAEPVEAPASAPAPHNAESILPDYLAHSDPLTQTAPPASISGIEDNHLPVDSSPAAVTLDTPPASVPASLEVSNHSAGYEPAPNSAPAPVPAAAEVAPPPPAPEVHHTTIDPTEHTPAAPAPAIHPEHFPAPHPIDTPTHSYADTHSDTHSGTAPETQGTQGDHAETSQEVTVKGGPVFENKLGTQVDLRVAHGYELKGYKDTILMTGGTHAERFAKINAFYSDPANYGSKTTIVAPGDVLDPKTHKPYLNAYRSNGEEGFVVTPKLMQKHGGIFGLFAKTSPSSAPDPEIFTKRVI